MIPTIEQLLLDMEENIKQLHASPELDNFQNKWEDLKERIKVMQDHIEKLKNPEMFGWS